MVTVRLKEPFQLEWTSGRIERTTPPHCRISPSLGHYRSYVMCPITLRGTGLHEERAEPARATAIVPATNP